MPTSNIEYQDIIWTNIVRPTQEDIHALSRRYPQFHHLNLVDCLSELEYPKLDHKDGYLFLVFQIPYYDELEHSYRPAELDIFIFHHNLVTIHHGKLRSINQAFAQLETEEAMRAEWMQKGASPLLYRLLSALVNDCYPIVHESGKQIKAIEQDLFHNDTRTLLRRVAEVRRNIIISRSVLNTGRDVMMGLFNGKWDFIQETLDPYWEDIAQSLAQLCFTLDQYAEVISGLSETVDTLASHRIDEVVSLLTIVTILTLPVTLLSTVFSMNVYIPYRDQPLVFFGVILLGVCVTAWLVWYLRKRRYL